MASNHQYATLATLLLLFGTSTVHRTLTTAITAPVAASLNVSTAEIGVLSSTFFIIYAVLQTPAGATVDIFGPRAILTIASIVTALGSVVMALAKSFAALTVGRAVAGLGTSVMYVGVMSYAARKLPLRMKARIAASAELAGNIGAVLGTGPMTQAVESTSWTFAILLVGGLTLALGLLVFILMRGDEWEPVAVSKHLVVGSLPASQVSLVSADKDVAVYQETPVQRSALMHTLARHAKRFRADLTMLVTDVRAWPPFVVNAALIGAYSGFIGTWAVPLLANAGVASPITWVTISTICAGASSMAVGFLCDHLSIRKPLLIASSALFSLAMLGMYLGLAPQAMVVVIGIVIGGYPLTYVTEQELFLPRLGGIAAGFVNTGYAIGASVVQSAGTPLWKLSPSYVSLLTLAVALAGLVAALLVFETHGRPSIRVGKSSTIQAKRSRAWMLVRLANLEHNVRVITARLPPHHSTANIIAVVKADGYGHGIDIVSQHLFHHCGISSFTVHALDESVKLKRLLTQATIIVWQPLTTPQDIETAYTNGLEVVLYDVEQARLVSNTMAELCGVLRCHIKVDAGMHRLGFNHTEIERLWPWLETLAGVEIVAACSHMSHADCLDPSHHQEQMGVVQRIRNCIGPVTWHVSNSATFSLSTASHTFVDSVLVQPLGVQDDAAVIVVEDAYCDAYRIGLALYGFDPTTALPCACDTTLTVPMPLRQLMSIQAVVASIKSARKGEFVGYGDSYCLPHDAYIGVLTIGYGDGVPVLLSNKLEVLIGGCRVRQVGSICMDMLMVELPAAMVEHGTITLGAVATLLGSDDAGNEIGLDEWAQWLGTHRWQVLTLFKPRLQRITV